MNLPSRKILDRMCCHLHLCNTRRAGGSCLGCKSGAAGRSNRCRDSIDRKSWVHEKVCRVGKNNPGKSLTKELIRRNSFHDCLLSDLGMRNLRGRRCCPARDRANARRSCRAAEDETGAVLGWSCGDCEIDGTALSALFCVVA